MNRKVTYVVLVILVTGGLYFLEKYADRKYTAYPEIGKNDQPEVDSHFGAHYLPASTTGALVEHTFYTLSYSEAHEQAEWVAYELHADHIVQSDFDRPYFHQDRLVKSESADWRNYKGSGFDRGHLCPAGDREFSFDAYHETFLTSNISPQRHEFNAGIWNRLEQKTRYWAKKYEKLYVITGGVLDESLPSIGDERVSIPNAFYKILLKENQGQKEVIAFLIPHHNPTGSFYDYMVTVDEIEGQTGIDFFPALPNSEESALESTVNAAAWGRSNF